MMFIPRIALTQVGQSAAIAPDPITLAPTVCVRDAIAQLYARSDAHDSICDLGAEFYRHEQARRSCVLVLEAGRLVGIATERELLRLSVTGRDLAMVAIAEVMSAPVMTLNIAEFTDYWVPLNLLQQHHIRHLPLVDARGQVVGLLTQKSLLHLLQPFAQMVEQPASPAQPAPQDERIGQAALHERNQAEIELQQQRALLRTIIDTIPNKIFVKDQNGRFLLANRALAAACHATVEELVGKYDRDFYLDPVDVARFLQENQTVIATQTPLFIPEEKIYFDGHEQWFQWQKLPITLPGENVPAVVGIGINITSHKQAELRLAVQNDILERIAKAEPLLEILDALLSALEGQFVDALCSIMLCDRNGAGGGTLYGSVASQLPDAYLRAIEGIAMTEGIGSCGTAAFRQKTVIVSDIAADPLWQNLQQLTLEDRLRACWSIPIIIGNGQVLGTLAVYHHQIYMPDEQALLEVAMAANIAGIAIEREQATQALTQLNQELERRVEERTAALHVSEERWQLVLRGTNDGIWDWDVKHERLFVSSRWKAMRGFAEDEANDRQSAWSEGIHPNDYERVMAAVNDHFAGKTEFFELEYRVRRKDGTYFWILDRGQALRDQSGQVVRISGSETDITDRKLAAAALQASERRYATLASAAPVAIFRFDVPLNCIYVNDRWSEMTGRPQASAMGRGWIEALHPEDRELLLAQYAESYAQAAPEHRILNQGEGRHLRPDGSINWFYLQISQETDAAGTVTGYIGTLTDITARKQAETKLQQQSDQEHLVSAISQQMRASLNLQEILDTTVSEMHQVLHSDRVLIYQVLPDGTGKAIAESVSPGWPIILDMIFPEEIFPRENYDRYVQGRIFALSDRETEAVLPCLAEFLKGLQVRAKLIVPIIQNETLWGLLIVHQCEIPRQWQAWEIELLWQLAGQLAIAIHQSELYAKLQESHHQLTHTNAELLRATRLKDEFLANMSHELRTPLNAILGMSEGLQDDAFGAINPRQKKAIATIERSGQHLLSLINDILDVSKIEAGKLELELAAVSVTHLCTSSLLFVKQQALKKQIQLKLTCAPDLSDITVDERRMRQVLINLLTNAVKFTPAGGQITLEADLEPIEIDRAAGASTNRAIEQPDIAESNPDTPADPWQHCYFCLSVTDTGIGIAAADQAKLFQPFVQIDSSLNRQYEGTGLGLTLVKQIVELHGGSISLHSTLGQGSCFTVRLPHGDGWVTGSHAALDQAASPLESIEMIEAIAPSPLILLAEDNETNVTMLSSYLMIKNYRVLVAANGQAAIELTKIHAPDLILMDIQMPRIDGLTAMRQIRSDPQWADLPIVALTAMSMPDNRQQCLDAGATDYLTKPVSLKQLTQMIETLLALKHKS